MSSDGGGGNNVGGAAGPCGACKFLRRKCVKGCMFAPYFDSDQGTAHFAAVHKIFGASNASKLLLRIPPHKRLDAVVSLCYEALARVKDPVYGSVAHIFTLQQQVVNLQAELSYTQARLSTLQRLPHHLPQPQDDVVAPENNVRGTNSSCLCSSSSISTSMPVVHFDDEPQGLVSVVEPSLQAPSLESMGRCHIDDVDDDDDANDVDDGELQALAREFVSRFLPQPRRGGGVIFKPPSSN